MNLNEILYAISCAKHHITIATDTKEHTFVVLACPRCDSIDCCVRFAQFVEKELNRQPLKKQILARG